MASNDSFSHVEVTSRAKSAEWAGLGRLEARKLATAASTMVSKPTCPPRVSSVRKMRGILSTMSLR
ncbi:hypothetical protein [Jiella avicenniae]|uniref:Uncharacterized protein n=1 Tax=Jiella avicenniae TaxID=2907202 RepID=A0A9X1NZA2_9HYPH|nr:hypothetical protein [Jiella avicenniae]MCE7027014.1 hypothetical protein [Jiella avicenniae]